MALLNLAEAAKLCGLSVPTFRALLAEPGLPVVKNGGKGDAYAFDGERLAAWWSLRQQRQRALDEQRAEEIAQLGLDLVGGTSVAPETAGLSPKDRRAYIDAELAATNLARLRGELVDAAELEESLTNAFTALRTEVLQVPGRVAERYALSQEIETAIADAIAASLTRAQELLARLTVPPDTRIAA